MQASKQVSKHTSLEAERSAIEVYDEEEEEEECNDNNINSDNVNVTSNHDDEEEGFFLQTVCLLVCLAIYNNNEKRFKTRERGRKSLVFEEGKAFQSNPIQHHDLLKKISFVH